MKFSSPMKCSLFAKFCYLWLLLLFINTTVNATTYYVSTSGNNSNNGTSPSTPWQSLNKVQSVGNNGTIKPGDFILFKKGDTFTGTIYWSSIYGNNGASGTASNPITLGAYGTGAKPIFLVPAGSNSATTFAFVGVQYIVFDGLNFTDLTFPISDKVSMAPCGVAIQIGSYGEIASNHCTVKNTDISNVGEAIVIVGDFNTIDSTSMTDLKNVKNTPGGDDDYGANGVTITGSDNIITHNYFSGNWASSYDYGWNGGALEMFDACSRNKIMYNTMVDCGGVAEFGAYVASTVSSDNLFAYNKVINCGMLSWCNLSGSYTTNVNNTQYFNNVVIENSLSRFSGPNNGAGVTTNPYPSTELFAYNGNPPSTVYNLKNNIFALSTGINVLRTSSVAKTTHANNIYQLSNGSKANYTLDGSEINTTATLFANTTNPDPSLWDFNPATGSPAISFGQNVGIPLDFAGNAVAAVPNAGVYEKKSGGAPSTLKAVATPGTISCNGATTTVVVTATGGIQPYSGTGTFTVAAGTFNYTVKDAAGASATTSVTITQPTALTATLAVGVINIFGGATSITVTASGGTAPYTYSINGTTYQTSNIFNSVLAGLYNLIVKDAKGCTITKSISVTQPAAPSTLTASATSSAILCNGSTSTVTVTATGGTTPYSGTGNFTVGAGTYNYTVTDAAGQTATTSITVSQPTRLTANASAGIINTYGGTTSITATAAGGTSAYTYKLNSGSYQGSNIFNNISAGTYTITVKDANGCTVTTSVTITQPAATLTASSTSGSIACNGSTTTVTVTATGGVSPYTGTGTFTVAAGTYNYTVTDAAGNTANTSITVTEPTALGINLSAGVIAVYGGTTNITVTASGGTASYTYKLNSGSYKSSNVFNNIHAGTYTITVKDSKGCTISKSITIDQPAPTTTLTASSAANDITCNGGTTVVTVTATGGTQPYTGTGTFTVSAGTYNYTVTDAVGNTAATSITISQPNALNINASTGTIAVYGGTTSINITATGGTPAYSYKLNSGSYQGSNIFTNVAAGTYTITIQDENGCSTSKSITITQPAAPVPLNATAVAGTISCNGGNTTVTVSATGGTQPYTGTGTFTVTAGTYNYTVTDAAGLTAITTVTITQPTSISVSLSAGSIAVYGGSTSITATATGGKTAYSYKLDNGNYQASNVFSNVVAGSYTITVKDANGCTQSKSITITQPGAPAALDATAVGGTISCNGSNTTVTVTAIGGTQPYTGTGTFTVTAGTYNYTVTDSKGLTDVATVTITQPTAISVSLSAGSIAIYGGSTSITTTAGGGKAAYTYKLNNGNYQASNVFNSIVAGTYTVTVKDANGCTQSKSITVTQPGAPGPLTINVVAGSISCNGGTTSITVSAAGGTSPYSGIGSFTKTAGTYSYTVTDAAGVKATKSVTITQPTLLNASIAVGSIQAYGGSTSITITASGGTSPYQYSVSASSYQSLNVFNGVKAGSYTIVVKDAKGCTTAKVVSVVQPAEQMALGIKNKAAGCAGGYDGTIEASILSGGQGPYKYSINDGPFAADNLFANLKTGTYKISVKDSKGLITSSTVSVADGTRKCRSLYLTAFPNPTTTEFSLNIESDDSKNDVYITVINLLGQKVYSANGRINQRNTFGRDFRAGAYILKVTQGSYSETIKLVKFK